MRGASRETVFRRLTRDNSMSLVGDASINLWYFDECEPPAARRSPIQPAIRYRFPFPALTQEPCSNCNNLLKPNTIVPMPA